MRRFYLFVFLQTVCENIWQVFRLWGVSDEVVYDRVNPFFSGLNACLIAIYFTCEVLSPSGIHAFVKRKKMWAYWVGWTYIAFQLFDAIQYATNGNVDNPSWEFIIFIGLNIIYWRIFKDK